MIFMNSWCHLYYDKIVPEAIAKRFFECVLCVFEPGLSTR